MFNLKTYLKEKQTQIDAALDHNLPPAEQRPAILHRAMRYSVLGGGKRLRPILCLAASGACNGDEQRAMFPALSLEVLHTYSLIHDDLPAMDDDDLRRGRPACHIEFGEADAILAGDALLTLAFEFAARVSAPAPYSATMFCSELAEASGSAGMVAGQIEDMAAETAEPTAELIDYIHRNKTAALIRAACRMGAIAAGAPAAQLEALSTYGENIGIAFQIMDDILDITSTAEELGKPIGSDVGKHKATSVSFLGIDGARQRAAELIVSATVALQSMPGNTAPLISLAAFIVERTS